MERHIVNDDKDKVTWSIRILSRNTDVLTTKVAEAIKTGKCGACGRLSLRAMSFLLYSLSCLSQDVPCTALSEVEKLSLRLKKLQERISKTKVFGRGITKNMRMELLDIIKEIQTKVDMMHKMLAEYTRDKTRSVELLARANDLRFAAQVSRFFFIFWGNSRDDRDNRHFTTTLQ